MGAYYLIYTYIHMIMWLPDMFAPQLLSSKGSKYPDDEDSGFL